MKRYEVTFRRRIEADHKCYRIRGSKQVTAESKLSAYQKVVDEYGNEIDEIDVSFLEEIEEGSNCKVSVSI